MNRLALVLLGAIMFIDGYDLAAMPLAVPHLIARLDLAPAQFGIVFSAVVAGIGTGALLLGPLGDRWGRRLVLTVSTAGIALANLGTITAGSVPTFALWRLLTGIALGACLPNATALSAELAPPGRKASTMTLISCGISVGGMVAGFLSPPLVRVGGWQALFVVPAVLTGLIAIALPRVIRDTQMTAANEAPGRASRLFRPPLLAAMVVFTALYTINSATLYGLNSWVPTMLPLAGLPVDLGARVLGLMQGGGLLAGLLLAALIDRRPPALVAGSAYAVVAAALAALALISPAPTAWGILLVVGGGLVAAIHLALMAIAASRLFPSEVLSSAIGVGVAIARLGAIAGPLAGGALMSRGVAPGTLLALHGVPVMACLALVALLPGAERAAQAQRAVDSA